MIPNPAERQSSDLTHTYIYIIPSHRMVKVINDAMWVDERARAADDVGLLLLYPKLEMLQSNDHHKWQALLTAPLSKSTSTLQRYSTRVQMPLEASRL